MKSKAILRKMAAIFAVVFLLTMCNSVPAYAQKAEEQDLKGRVIILDAGHGRGNSPGYAGYVEHEAMFKLATKIKPLLEARGATVLMTRQNEENISLQVRAALVNKWAIEAVMEKKQQELLSASTETAVSELKSDLSELNRLMGIIQSVIDDPGTNAPKYLNTPFDYTYTKKIQPDWQKIFEYEDDPVVRDKFLFISLHSNATPEPINTSKNGVIVYYSTNTNKNNAQYYANYAHVEQSYYFGKQILENINSLGIRKIDVAEENYLVLREHNVPGVLVENGFHTNSQDRARLSDNAFLDKLAIAYDKAILDYFTSYIGPLPNEADAQPNETNAQPSETEAQPSETGIQPDEEENDNAVIEIDETVLTSSLATASEWARDGIQNAIEKGIVPDELQGDYKNAITRAEFCLLAVKYIEQESGRRIGLMIAEMGIPLYQKNVFADTDDPNIYAAYVLGITNGIGSDMLSPDGHLTREQAAVMLMNICMILGKNIGNTVVVCNFEDMDEVSDWAVRAINYCVSNRLMEGMSGNNFNPLGQYSREQSILTLNSIV